MKKKKRNRTERKTEKDKVLQENQKRMIWGVRKKYK